MKQMVRYAASSKKGGYSPTKAKFFCENCGAEVPEKARFCKHCGKFFTATRCPKCGATGPASAFTKGCPQCGYAAGQGKSEPIPKKEDAKRRLLPIEKKRIKEAFGAARAKGLSPCDERNGTLPVWVYAITTVAVLAALFGVYSCMK